MRVKLLISIILSLVFATTAYADGGFYDIAPDGDTLIPIYGLEPELVMMSAEEDANSTAFELINLYEAQKMISKDSEPVRVAIIDSGIALHKDIADNVVEGYNYIDGNTSTESGSTHGTQVAAMVVAVNPYVELVPLKISDDSKSGTFSKMLSAIEDAVNVYDCRVINLSQGVKYSALTTYAKSMLDAALQVAEDNGVTVVAAAGNDGNSVMYAPASEESVIGVGAINSSGEVAAFSQRNDSVWLTAPGVSMTLPSGTDSYTSRSGTSFSTPLVAGLVSLCYAINPEITADEIREILKIATADMGDLGYDTCYGYGIPDSAEILKLAKEKPEFYLSPLRFSDGVYNLRYHNLTDKSNEAVCAVRQVDGTVFSAETTDIEAKGEFCIQFESQKGIKQMLWSGFEDMKPLTDVREN